MACCMGCFTWSVQGWDGLFKVAWAVFKVKCAVSHLLFKVAWPVSDALFEVAWAV